MLFDREITTKLTGTTKLPGFSTKFTIEIVNTNRLSVIPTETNNDPIWYIYLIDYDDNIGVIGEFPSEIEAIVHIDDFIRLATPLYSQKLAKYGRTPIITLKGDELIVTIPED